MAFKCSSIVFALGSLLSLGVLASALRSDDDDDVSQPPPGGLFAGIGQVKLKKNPNAAAERKARACEKAKANLEARNSDEMQEKYRAMIESYENLYSDCKTGIQLEFVKADSLIDSLSLFDGNENVMLAFDLDGTLNYMKWEDTVNTMKVLMGTARNFEKVVVTAASPRVCQDTVLPDLKENATGTYEHNDFSTSFGFTPDQTECQHETVADREMYYSHGIAMLKYQKAEAIIHYLSKGAEIRGDFLSTPEQLIFYDDYVTNPTDVAYHFCNIAAPEGLKKVSVVWFATSVAQAKSETTRTRDLAKLESCTLDLSYVSEDSYFTIDNENDVKLNAARHVFEGADNKVTPWAGAGAGAGGAVAAAVASQ